MSDETIGAPDVWDASVAPGGYVCQTCGTPTESEPCAEHQGGIEHDDETLVQVMPSADDANALLASWRCCGSPGLCGARCMDDEESHRLAQLVAFIDNERANNSGLLSQARRVRALAESWRDGAEVNEWNPLDELDAAIKGPSSDAALVATLRGEVGER